MNVIMQQLLQQHSTSCARIVYGIVGPQLRQKPLTGTAIADALLKINGKLLIVPEPVYVYNTWDEYKLVNTGTNLAKSLMVFWNVPTLKLEVAGVITSLADLVREKYGYTSRNTYDRRRVSWL